VEGKSFVITELSQSFKKHPMSRSALTTRFAFCQALISSKLIFAFVLMSAASESLAQGNLLIMPRRVVFEGQKRSEELNLANIGKDSATYVISMIQVRMKDDGTFQQITAPDSGQQFADKHLRFFPRTVTLAPNESQVVKVQLIRPTELKPGELRSHLYFRAIPKNKPMGSEEAAKDSSISISIVPVFGISIPAIVRTGESTAGVHVSDTRLEYLQDTIPALRFTLNRSGNMSVYGDVLVNHISAQGKITQVGLIKGLAVYTPNAFRQCQLVLDRTKLVDYHSGKLRLTYTEQGITRQNQLADAEVLLH
jgi:P pilus assembly chaperone PapD